MHAFRSKFKANSKAPNYTDPDGSGPSIDTRGRQHANNTTPFRLSLDVERPDLSEIYSSQSSVRSLISPRAKTNWPSASRKSASVLAGQQGMRAASEQPPAPAGGQHYVRSSGGSIYGGSGQAETGSATAWGAITGAGSEQRIGGYASPPSHHQELQATGRFPPPSDGGISPRNAAVQQDLYATPPTAQHRHGHRPSISTVLSADAMHRSGPPLAGMPGVPRSHTTPRVNSRPDVGTGNASRRYSQIDFDTYNERSVATTFGLESQMSRPNFDDSSMYAHTPGRDAALAAMHVMGRNPVHFGGANGLRTAGSGGIEDNLLTPDTPSLSISNVGRAREARHSRVNSLVSPPTRNSSVFEDGSRHVLAGGRAPQQPPNPAENPNRRSHAAQSWYGAGQNAERGGRDAFSDTFAWGSPETGRPRAGSFAFSAASATGRQHHQETQRTNGLSAGATRSTHRPSHAGSTQSSIPPSVAGGSQIRDGRHGAGSRSMETGSIQPSNGPGSSYAGQSRKPHQQSQHPKLAKTPIRSNWYYKYERLNDSDVKDQEFSSSDEEDFGREDRGYGGDLVSQQKLIQKQQREIFDLNMRCKILAKAMNSKTQQPYEALVDDFGRTCASNRRANREIEQLRGDVQAMKERCEQLEVDLANPLPCPLPHGMSIEEQEAVDMLRNDLEEARRELDVERSVTQQRMHDLERSDAEVRELKEQLTRERLNAEHWQRTAMKYSMSASVSISPNRAQGKIGGSMAQANDDLSPYRARAGTATTTSETVTLRAPSDASGAEDQASLSTGRMSRAGTATSQRLGATVQSSKFDLHEKAEIVGVFEQLEAQKVKVEAAFEQSEVKRQQVEDELKQTKKKMREYEEQRRLLQLELKQSLASRLAVDGGDRNEITRLVDENDTLKDECDALKRQLDDAQIQIRSQAEAALAAVNSIGTESEDEMGGSAAQRAEISKLKLDCRDWQEQSRLLDDHVRKLGEELERSREQMYRFTHDFVRPYLRESTVGPTQAEAVCDQVRQWSQLQVVAPPQETPTKGGRAYHQRHDHRQSLELEGMSLSSPSLLAHSGGDELASISGMSSLDSEGIHTS
ncbi:hypothetical protein GQ54DRAFT_311577 [Martensiomyces pterosporus]|nr:hypothetical protein GQ54DRAFT_311577 [Martensiomyces pterosporus]